jgi:hypothetical protein
MNERTLRRVAWAAALVVLALHVLLVAFGKYASRSASARSTSTGGEGARRAWRAPPCARIVR